MRTFPRGLALLLVLVLLLGQGLESFHQHEDEVPVGFAWTVSHCAGHPARAHLEPAEPTPDVCLTCTLLSQAGAPAVEAPPLTAFASGTPVQLAPSAPPSVAPVSGARGRAPPSCC